MKRDRVISEGDSGPFILLTGVELCFALGVVNDIPVQKTQKCKPHLEISICDFSALKWQKNDLTFVV